MSLRNWFHLGFSLLGVYYLAEVCIALPGVFVLLEGIKARPMGFETESEVVKGLGAFFLRFVTGLFLLRKSVPLSDLLARRSEHGA